MKGNGPDPYLYWRIALEDILNVAPAATPQPGFWRMKDGSPVAIWREDEGDEELHCLVDGEPAHAVLAWRECASRPISEETYNGATDEDEDEAPSPPPDHNQPDLDSFLALKFELDSEVETAEELLRTPVKDQETADRVGVWAKKLSEIEGRAETRRVLEKEPHLSASREVDAKWKPLTSRADEVARRLKAHIQTFLLMKKAAERARAEAAQREADAAWAKAQTIGSETERAVVVAQAQAAEEASAVRNATAGRVGMKVGLRSEKRARIVDYAACLAAVADHADVREVVEKLAQKSVRGGHPLPGVEVVVIEKVV